MSRKNAFNTVTPLSKILALVMFVMFPITAFYLGTFYQEKLDKLTLQDYEISKPISEKIQKACTMEAKQCPDGSYVGRHGPKCEFAQCPGIGSR